MKYIYLLFGVVLLVLTLHPLAALGASGSSDTTPPSGFGLPTAPSGSGGTGSTVKLANPLGDIDSFKELIEAILRGAMVIGLPIAVLFIVFAGFKFVWARGNPGELQKARTNLLYTIIGIAVFFGAWLITSVITGTLEELGVKFSTTYELRG